MYTLRSHMSVVNIHVRFTGRPRQNHQNHKLRQVRIILPISKLSDKTK